MGRFVNYAKRVVTFARWVMDAFFVVNLLRVKGAFRDKVCRASILILTRSTTTVPMLF